MSLAQQNTRRDLSGLATPEDRGLVSPAPAERRKLLVPLSLTHSSDQLQTSLQKRLRVVALVAATGFAAWFGLGLLRWHEEWITDPWSCFSRPPGYGKALLGFCLQALAALLLTTRSLTTRRLRQVEWIIFGALAAFFADKDCMNLRRVPLEDLSWNVGTFANDAAVGWVMLMIAYGVMVPNTWRRCATAVGLMSLAALIPAGFVLYAREMPAIPAAQFLGIKTIQLAIAAVIIVHGAHRIELLSEEVRQARKIGQYQLNQRLGAGGMGEVYLAEHVLLRRPCAIKLIRPEWAGDPRHLHRFEREVQVTATLTHPNTVEIYDYGHTEDGTFYYVMEYLPGLTLDRIVAQYGPLPFARVIHFLRQLCGALREAHAIGLIHRDIKPSNVMACQRGLVYDVVKLLDFGLVATPEPGSDGRQPRKRIVVGTPAYMSPEQASGKEMDSRSDIYSLGCLAYFLLTARPPMADRRTDPTTDAPLDQWTPALRNLHPRLPAQFEAILLRCLARNPDERFLNVKELESCLSACPWAELWTADEAARWWQFQEDRGASAESTEVPTRVLDCR
jgi:serine/threonine-protein kinase